jgi:hypothetical protein
MKPLLPLALLLASCASPRSPAPTETAIARLERDVRFLASDDMKGRDNATPEGAAAADYVAKQMEEAGLKPAGENGTWFQAIPGRKGDRGRNVIGAIPGATPEWIVVGAHFDGLGVRGGEIHNGADDNASGVAVLLEAARALRGSSARRGLLFCSFDVEEDGLAGSNHLVKSGLHPISSIAAMICLDLVGGTFLPGDEHRLFAMGSESSGHLFDWMGRERGAGGPLRVERAGIYAIEPMGALIARSDYSPFRLKKVPFVFFSTGTPWYYHTPDDDVERLDFTKMGRVADLVTRLARDLATLEGEPAWRDPAPAVDEDVSLMKDICRRILDHPGIRPTDRQRKEVSESLQALEGGGKSAVQRAMMAVFDVATSQKPAH